MFNNSKAWSLPLSHRLDSDRILAMLSVSATNLIDVALENPATLLKLDGFQLPPRRSLEQLRAAGYVIKPRTKDPFSREDLDKVQDAMMRFVAFFGCSRVCQHDQAPNVNSESVLFATRVCRLQQDRTCMRTYQHPYRWISQEILGNSRPESHVQYLLRRPSFVDGKLQNPPLIPTETPAPKDEDCDNDDEGSCCLVLAHFDGAGSITVAHVYMLRKHASFATRT